MFQYQTEKKRLYYDRVIQIYQETGCSANRIAKMVPLHHSTISEWIANFVVENNNTPDTVMQMPQENTSLPEASNDVKELQKRVKELEAQLLRAEVKAELYDEIINVAEAKFKIPIRKKAGAKQ